MAGLHKLMTLLVIPIRSFVHDWTSLFKSKLVLRMPFFQTVMQCSSSSANPLILVATYLDFYTIANP